MKYPLVGKKTLYIGGEEFGPEFIGSDGITVTMTPGTTDIESLDGTISVPNGSFEEMSGSANIIIPDIATLMRIFPGLSQRVTNPAMTGGQVHFGAGTCLSTDTVPIVIHNYCDTNSENDIYIPAALLSAGGEFTFSGDPTVLEVDFTPTKTDAGYVVMGHGALDKDTLYNPETMQYEPIVSPVVSVAIMNEQGTAAPANTVAVNADLRLSAVVTREDKTTEKVTEGVTWNSKTPANGTIDDKGVVHGVKAGTTGITATVDGKTSPELTVTVTAAAGA